ncbi:lipid-A-disaccharide synthase [Propylenella binzhouense]|uniref:Lipid-A-disaccharide synthase n=1 Tax=Propylenella binzhouense TaxID=2555902 RepID=A0A964WT69_9HYPH|nr:lipid-A-disaccharide synthase [Propylenella binzhouense]MYZ47722.1 lipid-A-disaccharide synthase [Propylenella binzhouense]
MPNPLRIAIVVGEESGDQLAAGLMDALRQRRPEAEFFGVAGERMIGRGARTAFPVADVAVIGIGAIVLHVPRIVRRVHQAVDAVVAGAPDILVVVDSPGFTHSVAERVKRRLPDLPMVDFVSPSVWAWKSWRAPRMAKYFDHVLALLPFEPAVHRRLGGPPCTYVGHPLIERLGELRPAEGERVPVGEGAVLLVLPGSRRSEINRLMQPFGEAVARVAAEVPGLEVILPAVGHLRREIESRLETWPVKPRLVAGEAEKFAAFRRAHAALAASGTVTLELGLAGVPMVVAYRVDPIARLLKPLLKVPSIVLANLVLGENAIPEFLDDSGSPETLAAEVTPLLKDGPERRRQLAALARLDRLMALPGGGRPSDRAAEIVLETLAAAPARTAAAKISR